MPRAPDGHPDLTGMHDLAMLTPLERPAGLPAVLSDQEAAKLERDIAEQERKARLPIRGDREAPPKAATDRPARRQCRRIQHLLARSRHALQHRRWTETLVDRRDPPDGRVPPMTRTRDSVRSVASPGAARPTSDAAESNDPGLEPPRSTTTPNAVPLANAVSWASARHRDHRCCPTTSTTIFIRSCRHPMP